MMKCPFCNQENTRVIDSRPVPDNNSIRRRRQCDECHKRFTTYEKIETIPLTVIKKDQSRETYDRTKIQDGIMRACYKRPISVEQIERTIDEIETEIFNKEETGNSKYGNRRDCDEPLKRIRCRLLMSVLPLSIGNLKM